VIRIGDLIVDLERRLVAADGKQMQLTRKEYGILELLSSRPGVTVTKEMLVGYLYGGKDEPELKIIVSVASVARASVIDGGLGL